MSDDKTAGQWVGAIVGAVVGYFTGNVALGYSVGVAIGGYVDPPEGPTVEGPRLDDLSAQTAEIGAPMARIKGTCAVQGNVFWLENNELKEVVNEREEGGKGGGGTTTVREYEYFATFAVGLCEGPIDGIRRVWIGPDLVYDGGATDLGSQIASNRTFHPVGFLSEIIAAEVRNSNRGIDFKLYRGTDTQQPDPRIESDIGSNETPAFRGTAYIVFYDLPLKRYGNSLLGAPVKVEIIKSADGVTEPELIQTWDVKPDRDDYYVGGACTYVDSGVCHFHYQIDTQKKHLECELYPDGDVDVEEKTTEFKVNPVEEFVSDGPGPLFIVDENEGGDDPTYYKGDLAYRWVIYATHTVNGYARNVKFKYAANNLFGLNFNSNSDPSHDIVRYSPVGDPIAATGTVSDKVAFCVKDDATEVYVIGESGLYVLNGGSLTQTAFYAQSWNISSARNENSASYDGGAVFFFCRDDGVDTCHIIDPETGDIIKTLDGSGIADRPFYAANRTLIVSDGILAVTRDAGPDNWAAKFYKLMGVSEKDYSLSDIVSEEMERSEFIDPTDINVTDLTDTVSGYRIAGVQQIRAVLQPLQGIYPFDIVPSGYELKAVRRGKASVKTIEEGELSARSYDQEPEPALKQQREMDKQLPRKVALKHLDASREYSINLQYSPEKRGNESASVREIEVPVVLTADEAAQAAEVLQYAPWVGRTRYEFAAGPEHLDLEPADVVTLLTDDGQFEAIITNIAQQRNGVLSIKARSESAATWSSNAKGGGTAEDDPLSLSLAFPAKAIYTEVRNIRGASDEYWRKVGGMASIASNWPGGALMHSTSALFTSTDIQAIKRWASEAPIGRATVEETQATVDPLVFDRDTVLSVQLWGGELESITESEFLEGGNLALFGGEIIQFRDADLQSDGTYLISHLARGLYGSDTDLREINASGWSVGDKADFMLLEDVQIKQVIYASQADFKNYIKPVTEGRNPREEKFLDGTTQDEAENELSEGGAVTWAESISGLNFKPLTPVHVDAERQPNNDWVITWIRRSRWPTTYFDDGADAPQPEEDHFYVLFITADGTTEGMGAIKTSFTNTPDVEGYQSLYVGVPGAFAHTYDDPYQVRETTADDSNPTRFTLTEQMQIDYLGGVVDNVRVAVGQVSKKVGLGDFTDIEQFNG